MSCYAILCCVVSCCNVHSCVMNVYACFIVLCCDVCYFYCDLEVDVLLLTTESSKQPERALLEISRVLLI